MLQAKTLEKMVGNKQEPEVHDEAWLHNPIRLKQIIKASADACGIVLKNPKQNCPRCHGRGWTAVDVKTGLPVVCRCIFHSEDKHNPNEVSPYYLRPHNRAERRAQQKWLLKHPQEVNKEKNKVDFSEMAIEEDRD